MTERWGARLFPDHPVVDVVTGIGVSFIYGIAVVAVWLVERRAR